MKFKAFAVDIGLIKSMIDLLVHRGPDDSGLWSGTSVALGHRRLSIIDLNASTQPMSSVNGALHLVFNGEIFNYRQLRSEFKYPYRTSGDTEVLLAGLFTQGLAIVPRLRGQFAFAAYDASDGSLHLARDRLGILPLYYYHDAETFAFSSEIKALLLALPGGAQVDPASLDAYLAHRAVPAPFTLFHGVRKLPAGHTLTVLRSGKVELHRYWAPPAVDCRRHDLETVTDDVDAAVRSAVGATLVADVPVGAYLSGGVDSSLIVAIMSAIKKGESIETFCAGFGDERHDELAYALRVSRLVGSTHHEVQVSPEDFKKLWSPLTWHRDAPLSEPADIAVFRLAELARSRVKVVLSGEGGDELFAGYPKYRAARSLAAFDFLAPSWRPPIIGPIERKLPPILARMRILLRVASASNEAERFRAWFAPFTEAERHKLAGSLPRRDLDANWRASAGDIIDRMLSVDAQGWLSDNLLERGDRMSMAASLELRPPLLDPYLVDLAFKLPSQFKVRRGVTKWILKEVARRYLPSEIVDRRKVGFKVPLDRWFRGKLRDEAFGRLTDPSSFARQWFDRRAVENLISRHDRGVSSEEARLWPLLCLEIWHDVFFRQRKRECQPYVRPVHRRLAFDVRQ